MSIGFVPSKFNPSLYCHLKDDIKVLVHGDDFVASGERSKILKFKEQLANRFTIKRNVVGSGASPAPRPGAASGGAKGAMQEEMIETERKESRILNRIVRWTPSGWEYETDQRHAELIIQLMGGSITSAPLGDGRAMRTPCRGCRVSMA